MKTHLRCVSLVYTVLLYISFLIGFSCSSCNSTTSLDSSVQNLKQTNCIDSTVPAGLLKNKIKGQSFVAPPDSFDASSLEELKSIGADWIAVLPYAYFTTEQASIRTFAGGWWGEKPAGIKHTIQLAHQQGLKIMLKPQLWNHKTWIGALDFENKADWDQFHEAYTVFILEWAQMAKDQQADLFCIGTELKNSVLKYPQYWRNLIQKIRNIYKGPLTYASNWDNFQQIKFWDYLDYIGTDAYFVLSDAVTPTVCALKNAWHPIVEQMAAFSKQWKKPILFTEFGYMSVDASAHKAWELEAKRASLNSNQQAQANALQALFESFAVVDWWQGGFMWKWYPNLNAAWGEGKRNKDYTPQGKKAEQLIRTMYSAS